MFCENASWWEVVRFRAVIAPPPPLPTHLWTTDARDASESLALLRYRGDVDRFGKTDDEHRVELRVVKVQLVIVTQCPPPTPSLAAY